jgi:acyl carrier protein
MDWSVERIEETVNQILVEEFEVEQGALQRDALLTDLDLDSLDGVDLVVALEKAFHCRIAEQEAKEIKTLGDIYAKIISRVHAVNDPGGSVTEVGR